jgi:ribosome-associated translation inhibitor RaiA
MQSFNIRGKRVNIHNNNRIFVDGRDAKMRMWNNNSTKYINVNSGA